MRICPSCNKGFLRHDYGCDIECGECSAVFEIVDGNLCQLPVALPKPSGTILTPELRRELFFDKLVEGQSCDQIANDLREDGIVNVCSSTVKNYRENNYVEISRKRGQLASLKARKAG